MCGAKLLANNKVKVERTQVTFYDAFFCRSIGGIPIGQWRYESSVAKRFSYCFRGVLFPIRNETNTDFER